MTSWGWLCVAWVVVTVLGRIADIAADRREAGLPARSSPSPRSYRESPLGLKFRRAAAEAGLSISTRTGRGMK
jgi:hypothetical protein